MSASDVPRVLLVEDEAPILDGLDALFRASGFETTLAADGPSAVAALSVASRFDLVILDLMIPGVPGLEVLRGMRGRGDETPVLVLTARGAEEDIVAGLESGADDYVTKPFGIRELVARARGLLRRPRAPVLGEAPRRIPLGAVLLDLDALEVSWEGGALRLTAREGLLIDYLATRAHRPVTREELLVDVWGYRDGTIRTRTVDVHVQQLRTKLRAVPGGEAWIATVRGRGYRFEARSEAALEGRGEGTSE
ncbi:MAG: response regulator transcription factor [Myxococcota bacterium]|nr:response regulator transcription factor [Myxococcota bacterium]